MPERGFWRQKPVGRTPVSGRFRMDSDGFGPIETLAFLDRFLYKPGFQYPSVIAARGAI